MGERLRSTEVGALLACLALIVMMAAGCSGTPGVASGSAAPFQTDGPIQMPAEVGNSHPIPTGESATWAMFLPPNPTAAEITLLAASLDEATDAEVLGISFLNPAVSGVPSLTKQGYPPDIEGLGPVEGAILPPVNGAAEGDRMLVIGVRRPGTADARVAGLRLRYESGGVVFESVLNWYLVLREPATE